MQITDKQRAVLAMIPFLVFIALLVVFGGVRIVNGGDVLSSVSVLGVDIGGMDREQATQTLSEAKTQFETGPREFVVAGISTNLDPTNVGYEIDVAATVDRAMQRGRTGNPLAQMGWWLQHLTTEDEMLPVAEMDSELLETTLQTWDVNLVGDLPDSGGVVVEESELVARYPTAGRRIDRQLATPLMLGAFSDPDLEPTELPVLEASPPVSEAEIDRALNQAELMVSAPVSLTNGENTVRLERSDLMAALDVKVQPAQADPVRVGFDAKVLSEIVERFNLGADNPAVNAHFEPNGYELEIRSGRPGTRVDMDQLATNLLRESQTASRIGELPYDDYAPPAVTVEDLEAMEINHLVAEFTTGYDCCEPRVENIQRIADEIDGTIVGPGEDFSLNEAAGQRTEAKGYVEAPTIVRGEIVDTVGGGVSQFTTTMYNAALWGGYEIVSHDPHSFYFGRYPEGMEATLSWPQPDLVIRNDDDTAIYIDTSYGQSTITVRIYGDNDGRAVTGYQSSEGPAITVLNEGGPNARVVEAGRTDRFAFTEPPEPKYRANPDLSEDSEVITQYPREGWTVTVHRTITTNGDSETEEWPVTYLPQQQIVEVHPCKVPGSGVPCAPPPTTAPPTTEPPTTEPPETEPPETEPPATEPPTTEPPATEPPETEPPATEPPTTQPSTGTV